MYNITNRDHIGNYMEYLVNIGAYNNIYKEENRTARTDKGKGLKRIEYCNRCYCLYGLEKGISSQHERVLIMDVVLDTM